MVVLSFLFTEDAVGFLGQSIIFYEWAHMNTVIMNWSNVDDVMDLF